MNAIYERTSVRQYAPEKVSDQEIEKILKAGFCAPSAVNKQPWQLIVVKEKDNLEQLSHCSPYALPLKEAAFAIVVMADTSHHLADGYDIQDLAALTENMLIEAEDLGIGSVWLGIYPEKERIEWLKKHFELPDHIVPYWVVSFGYPLHEQKPKDKWDPAKIHYETYGKKAI